MGLEEVVVREPQAPGKAEHEFVGYLLDLVHKLQAVVPESRKMSVTHPHATVAIVAFPAGEHVLAELKLVRLFHVWCPCGWPDLRILLPADILGVPRHSSLDIVWEGKEGLGSSEGLVDVSLSDAVINDREEADILRRITQLRGDLVHSILEIMQRDLDSSVKYIAEETIEQVGHSSRDPPFSGREQCMINHLELTHSGDLPINVLRRHVDVGPIFLSAMG